MNRPISLLVGAGLGATVLYYFDPDRGRRRRSLLRDRATHSGHRLQDAIDAGTKDLRNRWSGYRASRATASRTPPGDDVLAERVRSRLGRVCSHPGAIEVAARQGRVILSGSVLAHELPLVIDSVLDVPGVEDVENRIETYAEAGNVPALQGEGRRAGDMRGEFMQSHWSPAARVIAGAGGAGATIYGLVRGGLAGTLVGLGGVALLARAASNTDLRRLTGIGLGRRGVDVQKTVRIEAPIEKVFQTWTECDNFPQFMTHVRDVERLAEGAEGRWRWTVQGPAGTRFNFDTRTTGREENRFLAWRTEPGSLIQHTGVVRFHANPDGSTTATVHMSYNPVAGTIGHVVARIFGADAKTQMDDDLLRMKTFIETGVRPHDAAAAPTAERRPFAPGVTPAEPRRTH